MKKIRKTAILLMGLIMALGIGSACVHAESTEISGTAVFNGSGIESSLETGELVKAFNDLQPGDDLTVTIQYTNEYSEDTDWYMANEVIQTLEKADAARKVVDGTGTPENGGYTYSIVHTDKAGGDTVLFSNDRVGGEAKPAGMEGLEQATNALDDWFFLQTLGQGEDGTVTMHVAFDGETEVNDYMDTDGEVDLRFAVELTRNGTPDKDKEPKYQQTRTGDWFPLIPFLLMMLAGLALLLLLLARRRKEDRKGGEA